MYNNATFYINYQSFFYELTSIIKLFNIIKKLHAFQNMYQCDFSQKSRIDRNLHANISSASKYFIR